MLPKNVFGIMRLHIGFVPCILNFARCPQWTTPPQKEMVRYCHGAQHTYNVYPVKFGSLGTEASDIFIVDKLKTADT